MPALQPATNTITAHICAPISYMMRKFNAQVNHPLGLALAAAKNVRIRVSRRYHMRMRTTPMLPGLVIGLYFLLTTGAALAYERPDAVSLSGGWEIAPVAPLIDIVAPEYREAKLDYPRPDFPTLAPQLAQVVPQDARPPASAQWRKIDVPCAWEQVLGIDYNKAAWYKRSVDIPAEWLSAGRHAWIEFDAVSCAAGVWLNGQWLGGHVGDFTRWRLDMTAAAKPGANELLVYVDELPGHVTQGFLCIVLPHHGGIWQDVRTYSTGDISIEPDGVYVKYDSKTHTVDVEIELSRDWDVNNGYVRLSFGHEGPYAQIYTSVPPTFISNQVVKARENRLTVHGDVFLDRWSPKFTERYVIGVDIFDKQPINDVIPSDYVSQRFAVRDIRIEGDQLLLNGQPIRLRSALNWGQYPRVVSPAPPPDVLREEFRQLKALGFNAETVCLIMLPDYYYDIADEEGILLWQEYPTWHATFDRKDADTYLPEFERFIRRDRNHPSIILRSMSCEAGVAKDNVMTELYNMSKDMTSAPSQDNTSWFWLSNLKIADWYDEHNYYNNNQWEKYLLKTLPGQLDELEPKPFLIGESMLFSPWPDTQALFNAVTSQAVKGLVPTDYVHTPREPLPSGLTGTDEPSQSSIAPRGGWPYWFPRCYQSMLDTEAKLRARYNAGLPAGEDIVRDYLMPQSNYYALINRKFQMELMFSSPRYTGYTINTVRDVPLVRAGLMDDLGRPRWTPEQWAWHGEHSKSPVQVGEDVGDKLSQWTPGQLETYNGSPCTVLTEGYREMQPMFAGWGNAKLVQAAGLPGALKQPAEKMLVTSVLTFDMVKYIEQGGGVLLLTSKWPGAMSSVAHMYWRDQPLIPPVGPWVAVDMQNNGKDIAKTVLELQMYDLTRNFSQVVPTQELGLADAVDPLIRLHDTHDLAEVQVFDQLFATRCGKGLLMVSSLDHATPAGQWVLGELISFGNAWLGKFEGAEEGAPASMFTFPKTSIAAERLKQFAVARVNGVLALDEGWRFKLDPDEQGEQLGWQQPGFADSAWDTVRTAVSWEALGYSYDGMGWYRRVLDVPADWQGRTVRLIADGIDDAYTVWVNGKAIATHGSFTDHEQTVWLRQTVTDITAALQPGQPNTLVLQVVDITGQGGIFKPLYITTE